MKFLNSTLAKKVGIYGLGQIIQQAGTFLLLPIYINYLSESEYGTISTLFALGALLSVIFSMSIDKAIYRLYHDCKSQREQKVYLFNVVLLFVVISIVLMGASHILFSNLDLIKNIEYNPLIILTILIFYFDAFKKVLVSILRVTDNTRKYFLIIVSHVIIKVFVIVYVLIILNQGVDVLLVSILGVDSLMILVSYLFIKGDLLFSVNKSHIIKTIKFTLPLIPTVLLAWAMNFSDRLFVESFIGINEVGHYNLMYKVASIGAILANSYYAAISPEFYRMAKVDDEKGIKQILGIYILISSGVSLFVLLVAKYVILLISPEHFHSSIYLVPIIVVGYTLSLFAGVFNLFIYQVKRTSRILLIYSTISLFNLSINFFFIKSYGLVVPAISTLLTFALNYLILYWYSKRVYFVDLKLNKVALVFLSVALMISYAIYF